jgi:hypothetical protein
MFDDLHLQYTKRQEEYPEIPMVAEKKLATCELCS